MTGLLELAERCERLEGPDWEVDEAIRIAFGFEKICVGDGLCVTEDDYEAPAYTASLDAAMMLAKDFGGQITFFTDGTAKVYLWQPYPMAVDAKATTPALALCAAALRARASQEKA